MNGTSLRLAAAFASLLFLSNCGGGGAQPRPPLEGAAIGGPFTLTDQHGKTVSDRDFAGRYRLMYFGYTFCPDACPTDMAKLGAALKLLDKSDPGLTDRLAAIFVTVDPERDTPRVVGQFVGNFYPKMIGLTGSPEAIKRVADEYKAYFKKQPPSPAGGYLVDHTRVILLMGPKGEPIAPLTSDMSAEQLAAEIKRWVK